MHPLCFPHCGQKHPAVESSSICAQAGQGVTAQAWHGLPGVFLGASEEEAEVPRGGRTVVSFPSSCIQSIHFPAFLPLQLSYPHCSSHPQSAPPMEKPKPCALESCIPTTGWVGPWNSSAVPVLLCPYSVCGDLD